jgi:hypothetical protein
MSNSHELEFEIKQTQNRGGWLDFSFGGEYINE